jgi:transposase
MAQNFLSCDRDQGMLLPASVADWLPEGHLAWFVLEVVGQLDLSDIYSRYRADGRGRPAHDPAMMTALLLYNYAVGVRASRVIERRCGEDVPCRVIAANRTPDHSTISDFRRRHRCALGELFSQVLDLCRQAGMVKVGTVAVDSTKLAANASLAANRTREQLRREAERILSEADEIDAREDELYGDRRGDELPLELADPRTRAGKIRELLERARAREQEIEAEREEVAARHQEHLQRTGRRLKGRPPRSEPSKDQRRALDQTKYNLTDPDSGVVRHRGMLLQGYNVHAAVADGQIILGTQVSGVSPDQGQLEPTVEIAQRNVQRLGVQEAIGEVLADSGYWHIDQVSGLKERGIAVLVPPISRASDPQRAHQQTRAMNELLASEDGKRRYRRRQQIVEPVFAHIKHIRGITQVLRRGKEAVQAEIDLIATTHNLLKLFRYTPAAA